MDIAAVVVPCLVSWGTARCLIEAEHYRQLTQECAAAWPELKGSFDSRAVAFAVVTEEFGILTVCNDETLRGAHALCRVSPLPLSVARYLGELPPHLSNGRHALSSAEENTAVASRGSSSAEPWLLLGSIVDGRTKTPPLMKFSIDRVSHPITALTESLAQQAQPYAAGIRAEHLSVSFTFPGEDHEIDLEDDADVDLLLESVRRFGTKAIRLRLAHSVPSPHVTASSNSTNNNRGPVTTKLLAAMPSAARSQGMPPHLPSPAAAARTPPTEQQYNGRPPPQRRGGDEPSPNVVVATPVERDFMSPRSVARSVALD